jgi:hypothetical protein
MKDLVTKGVVWITKVKHEGNTDTNHKEGRPLRSAFLRLRRTYEM